MENQSEFEISSGGKVKLFGAFKMNGGETKLLRVRKRKKERKKVTDCSFIIEIVVGS